MLNDYDSVYAVNQEDYSPESTEYMDVAEVPVIHVTHRESPMESSRDGIAGACVPKPPDPTVGGLPGISHGLGWSTGIRNSRAFRQRFDGRTLVVPNMGVNPIQGNVGFSARTDKLAYGVKALSSDNLPTNSQVSKSIGGMTGTDLSVNGNPNYA